MKDRVIVPLLCLILTGVIMFAYLQSRHNHKVDAELKYLHSVAEKF